MGEQITAMLHGWFRDEVRNRIVTNERDSSVLVYVPAGEFEMGDGKESDCPPHTVELPAYWIGVYTVSNAQYLRFVEATGHRAPNNADYGGQSVWRGKWFPPEKADHPVVCVSWEDAQMYACWAGCELASEAQWEKTCRGPLGLAYPWGRDWHWDGRRCRWGKKRGGETTARVYDYPGGVSENGTYNHSGNVWEWCADWYGEDYYKESPRHDPKGPPGGSKRVYRGGGWGSVDPASFRGAYRGKYLPDSRRDSRGLRLVRAAS